MVTPTVPMAIHNLAIPPPVLIDSQLPSYLLPCALDLLKQSTSYVIRKKRREEDALIEEGLLPPRPNGKGRSILDGQLGAEVSDEEEERRLIDAEVAHRVERIGLMVGGYVAEKSVNLGHRLRFPLSWPLCRLLMIR